MTARKSALLLASVPILMFFSVLVSQAADAVGILPPNFARGGAQRLLGQVEGRSPSPARAQKAAAAVKAQHDVDSRALTAHEQQTFLSLVCQVHYTRGNDSHCLHKIGYPNSAAPDDDVFRLTAILYGSFTHGGAAQAYASYQSSFEPHVNNFGGGISFERRRARWYLTKWYPGGQMENCLALPRSALQQFLCLTNYGVMGQFNQHIVLRHVPPTLHDKAVLDARDDRSTVGGPPCDTMVASLDGALLMGIGPLERPRDGKYLAETEATYATPDDIRDACARSDFRHVRTAHGIVRFVLRGGTVTVATPVRFDGSRS